MKKFNAISYIRVSTEEQVKNGNGLKIQKKEIDNYCKKNNIILLKEFSDKGISGANDISKRKGLNNLLQFIKSNNVQRLLITKMDRISRDVYIQLWVEKELKIYNVEILSIYVYNVKYIYILLNKTLVNTIKILQFKKMSKWIFFYAILILTLF